MVFQQSQTSSQVHNDKEDEKWQKQWETSLKRPVIVIPCEQKVLEAIARIMKKYNVPVAMKFGGHWIKDKLKKEDVTECVYRVPCANCNTMLSYPRETALQGAL